MLRGTESDSLPEGTPMMTMTVRVHHQARGHWRNPERRTRNVSEWTEYGRRGSSKTEAPWRRTLPDRP